MTTERRADRAIDVLKIGGSVLTDIDAYRQAAEFIAARCRREPDVKFVVVVSARHGETDALLDTARTLAPEPDADLLDLLWSTGELRSVALLALALRACGIDAAGANVHQTGLARASAESSTFSSLRLLSLLATHDVAVVPGFLARDVGDRMVSLGRGGSDLTAVLVAAGLGARQCELIKDVDGYYSADPKSDSGASHLPRIDFARSLALADDGCQVVQRAAIEAASAHGLPLIVRSMVGDRATLLSHRS